MKARHLLRPTTRWQPGSGVPSCSSTPAGTRRRSQSRGRRSRSRPSTIRRRSCSLGLCSVRADTSTPWGQRARDRAPAGERIGTRCRRPSGDPPPSTRPSRSRDRGGLPLGAGLGVGALPADARAAPDPQRRGRERRSRARAGARSGRLTRAHRAGRDRTPSSSMVGGRAGIPPCARAGSGEPHRALNYGYALSRQGKDAAAIDVYTEAGRLDPRSSHAAQNIVTASQRHLSLKGTWRDRALRLLYLVAWYTFGVLLVKSQWLAASAIGGVLLVGLVILIVAPYRRLRNLPESARSVLDSARYGSGRETWSRRLGAHPLIGSALMIALGLLAAVIGYSGAEEPAVEQLGSPADLCRLAVVGAGSFRQRHGELHRQCHRREPNVGCRARVPLPFGRGRPLAGPEKERTSPCPAHCPSGRDETRPNSRRQWWRLQFSASTPTGQSEGGRRRVTMRLAFGSDLDAVAAELNGRPRQTLGWRSPSQALDEALR